LSKEERQRRFNNKACLRCSNTRYFYRDCLENKKGKQEAIKIAIIKENTALELEEEPRCYRGLNLIIVSESWGNFKGLEELDNEDESLSNDDDFKVIDLEPKAGSIIEI
jgi:hypothetical protein